LRFCVDKKAFNLVHNLPVVQSRRHVEAAEYGERGLVNNEIGTYRMDISEGLAKQLLNATPDPGIVINRDGCILYANARVNDAFGYEPDELIDQHMEILLPERFRSLHPRHRNKFFKKPSSRPMGSGLELYVRRKNGEEIPVEISLSPVVTADGILVFAALRDVSVQKELQQQLKDASRAKSRFLAAASHDLRQPIQALTILNSIAKRTATDQVHQSIIEKQQKSLDSMARLLNALLDISKLEAGIVKPDITDCEVQEIFDDLHAEFDEQARMKGLELIIEPCGDVARSDSRLLTQILENFISNAIRYTCAGFVRLRCLHEPSFIRLEVLDTGLGIDPDDIGNIFDEFHQSTEGATRPEGLGLGLSIVKRTAELLECGLNVDSRLGKGSTFSISVPQGKRVESVAVNSDRALPSGNRTGTVLIVDDELAVLDATEILLNLEGFAVLTASSGAEALKCITGNIPDLLITDYHLRAGETGADVIRSVRGQAGMDVPVILVSGDTSDALALQDLDEVGFLTKPVDTDDLLIEINRRICGSP
jgi:PAS domain S-box-containing protein